MPLILRTNKDEPLTHAELDGNLTFLDQRITSLSNSEANKVITWTEIQSKPVLFDGDYNSLQNIPVLFDGDYNNLTNTPVVFDGNYQNLTNKPFIPTALNDLSNVTSPTPSIDQVLTWTGSTWAPQDTFDKDYNSLTNRPTIPSELSDLSNVSPVAPSEGEVLKWDGSEWAPAAGASGGAETDPIVGAINGIVKADGAGNISAAVAGTDYSTFDGDYNSLTNKPTIPTAYTDSDVDAHLNQSNPTSGHVLSWDGADYAWVANAGGIALTDLSVTTAANGIASLSYDNINGVFTYTPPDLSSFSTFDGDYNSLTNKPTIPTAYTDSDVDAHLNQSNPTSGYVLSWNGSDYAWVAQSSGGGGTDTVIAPFAFASVNTTANGSGVGMSWSNWDAVNGTMDFTFDNDNAQPDTNYIVVTDGEANDDGRLVSIQNKTVNGFEASFYDTNGIRTPSTADAYALIVYGSTPTATITGSNVSNASIGALSDVSISSATTGQVLKYNGSSWVNDTDAGGSVTNMASLTDVDSGDTVASGDFLLYDGSSSEYKFVAFQSEVNSLIDSRTSGAGHISTQSQYTSTVTSNPADTGDSGAYILGNTGSASATGSSTGWVFADIVQDPDNPGTTTILDVDNALLTGNVMGELHGDVKTADGGTLILDVDAGAGTAMYTGDVTGNVTGNVTGFVENEFDLTGSTSSNYVFNADSKYFTSNTNNPTLYLKRGERYKFKNIDGAHPFRIQSVNSAGGTLYNDGVTNNGGTGTVTFIPPMDAPDELYYYCANHSAMNGVIKIVGEGGTAPVTSVNTQTGVVVLDTDDVAEGTNNLYIQTRTTGAATATSLGDESAADITIPCAKTFTLLKIQTNYAAWVTLYIDTASRTNDAGRDINTDPEAGSGVLAEVITSDGSIINITPGTIGWNNDGTPAAQVYAKVVNKSGSQQDITVTLHYVALEV